MSNSNPSDSTPTESNSRSTHLIWIDLEMTGLDPDNDVIIEMATIVTDSQLNVLAEGPVDGVQNDPKVIEVYLGE